MPRHANTYPPEIRHSESGERLYVYWLKIKKTPHDPVFDLFLDFYSWAMNNGYADNLKLRKADPSLPWCPENCTWIPALPPKTLRHRKDQESAARWNATVNRLRTYYGMKPFPVKH